MRNYMPTLTGTAVYGTVRTVVWEDGGRKPASYPIDPVVLVHPAAVMDVVARPTV